jgi:hypothetical protein
MKVGYQEEIKEEVKEKYVVWHVEGGLGKNIAATSLLSTIKKTYPDRKFIMVASYPEIFLNFPEIDRVYPAGNAPYFYQDYIEDKDTIVFRHEGYFQSGHISKQQHLIQSWCEVFGLEYTNQQPVLLPNMIQKQFMFNWNREKPIMLLHTNGGALQDPSSYAWTRDMPPALVMHIIEKYSQNYHIMQICKNENQVYPGVEPITQHLTNFELASILAVSQKRVLIDSSLQHAAAAMKLPSTVLWVGTSPKVFGYDLHSNIKANPPKHKPKLLTSYLFDYDFIGDSTQCPYDDVFEIFDFKKVTDTIDQT